MKDIRHFIWDFDGTLFDTYPVTIRAMGSALRDLGGDCDPTECMAAMLDTIGAALDLYSGRFGAIVSDVLMDALGVAIKLSAPMLILALAVGVLIAIFQAVTQIHEQSLGFILKILVVIAVMLIGGGWMLETLQDYTRELFQIIAS